VWSIWGERTSRRGEEPWEAVGKRSPRLPFYCFGEGKGRHLTELGLYGGFRAGGGSKVQRKMGVKKGWK